MFGDDVAWTGEPPKTDGREQVYLAGVVKWKPVEPFEAHPYDAVVQVRLSQRWIAWIGYSG